jgi:hypothetical protein
LPAANDPQGAVRGALAALHRAFDGVPRPAHLTGCPCCAGRVDLARLLSVPRASLTAADLELYATKAITTVGTPDDFRWFLPRLLELLLTGELEVDVEIVLGKLAISGFDDWAPSLRTAIEEVLWAELTRRLLDCPSGVDEWLCGIALATRSLASWLKRLEAMDSVEFRSALARLRATLGSKHGASARWEGAPDQLTVLRAWVAGLPQASGPLYEEPGLFMIERATTGALWITVDRERGAGVVETIGRALTDVEARALAEGGLDAARALAWAVHDGRS